MNIRRFCAAIVVVLGVSVVAHADSGGQYSNEVKKLNPLVYIKFNGNLNDASLTGTYSGNWVGPELYSNQGDGAPLFGYPKNIAGLFSPHDEFNFVSIPNTESLDFTQEATLLAWVKFDRLPSEVGRYTEIIAKSYMAIDLDLQADFDNHIHFYVGDSGGNVVSQKIVEPGKWYFIAATYLSGIKSEIYVNGLLDGFLYSPYLNHRPNESPAPFTIGESGLWRGRFFPGSIDEVAIFNKTLSADEINKLYQSANKDITLSFVSGPDWATFTEDPRSHPNSQGKTWLGSAQNVCLNHFFPSPINCPENAMSYNWNYYGGWAADLSIIPKATWIWAPGVTPATSPADLFSYFFSKTFILDGPPSQGTIQVAADDFAEVIINGNVAGSVGSTTNIALAGEAQSHLTPIDITPFLKPGKNIITVRGQNFTCNSNPPCSYQENPAGVVFGGTLTFKRKINLANHD